MVAQRREDRHFLHMQQFSFVGFFSSLDVVSGDFFFRSAFELFLEAALPFAELLLCCSHQRSCELNPIERSVVFFFYGGYMGNVCIPNKEWVHGHFGHVFFFRARSGLGSIALD